MSDPNQQFHDHFAMLQRTFLSKIAESVTRLRQLLAEAAGDTQGQAMEEAVRLVHQYSGSGKTFGFPAISEEAMALEVTLEEARRQKRLPKNIDRLRDGFIAVLERAANGEMALMEMQSVETYDRDAGRKKVLIVDDSELIISLLVGLLQVKGYGVLTADSAMRALEVLRDNRPDFIILDYNMGKMNGIELLKKIKANPHLTDIPAMMLTGNHDEAIARASAEAGAIAYLVKPFTPQEVIARIEGVLAETQPLILIADDDPQIRELLTHYLAGFGYRLLAAADGEQALAMIHAQRPDLVLLDGVLPKMDGLQVLASIRGDAALAKLPVIMLTARRQEKDIWVGLNEGANDYMVKPFEPEAVRQRIIRLLNQR